jgi:hypothetical protein
VYGTWRRTTRAKTVEIEASSFARLKTSDKKEFTRAVERYSGFVDAPVNLTWSN